MLKNKINYWFTNSLEDIFYDTLPIHNKKTVANLVMVKNETESIQLGLRTNEYIIENICINIKAFEGENAPACTGGTVGKVSALKNTPDIGQKVKRCNLPCLMPEYINNNEPFYLSGNLSQGYFINITTTKETKAGKYETIITISAQNDSIEIPLTVEVCDVVLPNPEESDIDYICWINLAGLNGDGPKALFKEMNKAVYGINNYSNDFWKLGRNYAKILRKQRQNCINVPVYSLLGDTMQIDDNGNYIIDWTNFDKYCDNFIHNGKIKYLIGMHLLYRDFIFTNLNETSWDDIPLIGWYWEKKEDGKIDLGYDYATSEKVLSHLENFLPILNKHLEQKGYKKYWMQHVADETTSSIQQKATLVVYRMVKKYLNGVKTIDAGRAEYADCYKDALDIHTLAIDSYDKSIEKYEKAMQEYKNLQVFTYTCFNPRQDYLSRLGDYKLICTRLIFYYNFKHNINGFLHWAWNLWCDGAVAHKPYENGGWGKSHQIPFDAWMVYPDVSNLSVLESTRSCAVRDGLEDQEILKIAYTKNPQATMELVDIIVSTANEYLMDTEAFYRIRNQIIQIASTK